MSENKTPKKYLELLEEWAQGSSKQIAFTIPHGFRKREPDEQYLERQRIERQYKKLILESDLVSQD